MSARIIVIDDDQLTREMIAMHLMRAGYEVDQAVNGEEGLEKLKSNPYDLAITDYMMNRTDGIAVVRSLRGFDHYMPVILVTAYPSTNLMFDVSNLSRVKCLLKPVEMSELLEIVKSLVPEPAGVS